MKSGLPSLSGKISSRKKCNSLTTPIPWPLAPLTGMTASRAICQVSARKMTLGWIVPVVAQVPGVASAIGVEKTASVIGIRCLTKPLLISLTWDLE